MKRLLVTGGAGFIGSNFIRHILNKNQDYKVVNLDKLTYAGNLDNLKDVEKNPNYTFIKGDICDAIAVEKAIKDCDCIINFAASTHVDRSILDSSDFIKTNFYGTYVLLEAARKSNLGLFILMSTDEVYGSIKKGSFCENSPLSPNSPYSASKASADLLALSYYKTYGYPVIVVRSANNFGPFQYAEKLIPLFITNALDNKNLPLYGDGLNIRDWLYVEDTCRAIDIVLRRGKIGEIYNIAAGNELTNLAVTKFILKHLKKQASLIKFVKDRPGHDKRYSLKVEKMRNLGFKPYFTFREALRKTIDWYAENRSWWEKNKTKSWAFNLYYKKQYGTMK